jgi:hypothetical protein
MKNVSLAAAASVVIAMTFPAVGQQEKISTASHVDMKCYTELLGGGFMIYRNYDVPATQIKHFKSSLKELSKRTKQASVIYRVIECKQIDQKFRNKAAAKLDKLEENEG